MVNPDPIADPPDLVWLARNLQQLARYLEQSDVAALWAIADICTHQAASAILAELQPLEKSIEAYAFDEAIQGIPSGLQVAENCQTQEWGSEAKSKTNQGVQGSA